MPSKTYAFAVLASIALAGPIALPTPASKIQWPSQTNDILTHSSLPTPIATSLTVSPAPKLAGDIVRGVVSGIQVDRTYIRSAASAYAAVLTSATISSEAPMFTAVEDVINVLENVYLPQQPNGRGNPHRGAFELPAYNGSFPNTLMNFQNAEPDHEPQSIEEVEATLNPLMKDMMKPAIDGLVTIFDDALAFVLNGISPQYNAGIIGSAIQGVTNSFRNSYPKIPRISVYPRKWNNDAPYSVPEKDLRAAIYIPPGFTYGKKKPVILFPGTGSTGGDTFAGSLIPLMQDGEFDLVYVNVPGYMLDDAQVNAESAAYAMNYVSAISGNCKIGVVSWSQGGMSNQWALKYWPSTRVIVEDFTPISPDFGGTVMAYYLCPGFPAIPCNPSILQQVYMSNFVRTMRLDDGDSAYVPTTSIYSPIFDEIVEPQTGKGASAYLKDVRHVGVTNNAFSALCPLEPGGFATHEGALYNPLTYALVIDALRHDGPGQVDRLDLDELCLSFAAQGLSAVDVAATEALIPQALLNILLYFPKYLQEPPIMPYAYKPLPKTSDSVDDLDLGDLAEQHEDSHSSHGQNAVVVGNGDDSGNGVDLVKASTGLLRRWF